MLVRVFRALFGVAAGTEVDDLLLGWNGGAPESWEGSPRPRKRLP